MAILAIRRGFGLSFKLPDYKLLNYQSPSVSLRLRSRCVPEACHGEQVRRPSGRRRVEPSMHFGVARAPSGTSVFRLFGRVAHLIAVFLSKGRACSASEFDEIYLGQRRGKEPLVQRTAIHSRVISVKERPFRAVKRGIPIRRFSAVNTDECRFMETVERGRPRLRKSSLRK